MTMGGRELGPLTRRTVMLGGVAAMASAFLAACGGAPAPTAPAPTAKPAAPAEPTKPAAGAAPTQAAGAQPTSAAPAAKTKAELRLHVRTGAEEDTLKELLPKFTTDTGIGVKVESFPTAEFYQKLQTLLAGNQAGDVWWGVAYTGQFANYYAEQGIVLTIDELVKADKFDLSQYYEPALKGITQGGKLFALPFKLHPGQVPLYYNNSLVKMNGGKPPAPKTHDELIQMAKEWTRTEGGKTTYGLLLSHTTTPHIYIRYARAWGGDILSKDGKTATVNTEPVIQSLQWLSDAIFTHKVAPDAGKVVNADYGQMFISGVIASYNGASSDKSLPTRIKDKFEVSNVLMPKGPANKLGLWFVTDIMTINAKTQFKPESWELMKLLCGKELGIRLGEGTGGASGTSGGRKDVFEDPRLTKNPLHPIFVEAINTVEEGSEMIVPANYRGDEYRNTLAQKMAKVWLGEEKLTKPFMDDVNKTLQAILDKPKP
jgi:multiple sugar transport system substrate-binding protein